MHYIIKAKYLKKNLLLIIFKNGEKRVVDLEPHIGDGISTALKEIAYFKKVRVNQDIGTIAWANGADFSPDFLYEIRTNPELQPDDHLVICLQWEAPYQVVEIDR
ncbi:DUF2442 domain-containing protein [bacterium]|nr:DUF2442 domain-containing protein [bacterium]